MEITTEPVYIKDSNIKLRGNIIIKLCTAVKKIYPGEAYGAQQFRNNWLIYVRSDRTRTCLIVSGLTIEGSHIDIYNTIINDNSKLSEIVLIKDLPATMPQKLPVEYGTNLRKIIVRGVPPMVIAPVTLECVGNMTLTVGSLPLAPTIIRYQTIICAP